jgi:hypothetical protein
VAKEQLPMADDKFNQDQAPEKIENPTGKINENDLEQISGGMQSSNYANDWPKVTGNLVNGDGIKKNQFNDIPASKTVKL